MPAGSCDNEDCLWEGPWFAFLLESRWVGEQTVTLCKNCVAVWESDRPGPTSIIINGETYKKGEA